MKCIFWQIVTYINCIVLYCKFYFQQNTTMEQYQKKENTLYISVNTLKHCCICQWSPEKPQGSSSWQPKLIRTTAYILHDKWEQVKFLPQRRQKNYSSDVHLLHSTYSLERYINKWLFSRSEFVLQIKASYILNMTAFLRSCIGYISPLC